jgi:hypothetical protein
MSTATDQEPITGELIEAGLTHAPIAYHVSDAKIAELRKEFTGLKIATSGDYEKVTKAIAVCRTLRVQVDKCRKDLKEDALVYGRRVDAEAKRLTEALEAIEHPLKAEKQRVDEEKERLKREAEIAKQKQLDDRLDQLAAVNARVAPRIVAAWSEEEFQKELAAVRAIFERFQAEEAHRLEEEARKAAEAKAAEEAERLAREEALRIDRERLDKERAEIEAARKAEQAKLDAEREAMRLERLKLEQEKAEAERLAAIERAKVAEAQRIEQKRLEAERAALQAEKDRLEREQFERDEAERLKREELQRQEDAEKEAVRLELLRAEEEREAAAREAKERERLEALKPDREKFNAIAQSIRKLASDFPPVSNSESQHYLDAIVRRLKDTADFCEECLD